MHTRNGTLSLIFLLLLAPYISTMEPVDLEDSDSSYETGRSVSNTPLWSAQVSGSSSTDTIQSMAMDAMGKTYVCGYFYNTATFGQMTLTSYGSYDIFVGRLTNGNWDWVEKAGGSSTDQCQDIAVDDGGNITITGSFYSSATFGSASLSSTGSYDIFISRLDTNGSWQWSTKAGGSSSDYGYGVAVDNQGNAYVTGYYYSSGTVYFGSITLGTYSYDEAFVAKLDSSGQFVWAERMYGSYYQRGRDIDVNQNGDLVVTGEFSYRINIGGTELSPSYQSSSYYRIFVAKFDTDGNFQWAQMAGYLSSSYSSYGEGVAVDNNGNVAIVARFYYLVDFHTNSNQRIYAYQQSSNWDCLIAKWDSTGNYLWAQVAGGTGTDYCYDIEMDDVSGNISISGMFYGTGWFGNTQMSSSGGNDAFLAHIPANGGWDWMKKFGGSSSEYGWAVAMRGGMHALAGYFHNTASDGTGTTSLSSAGGADGFVLMFGSDADGDGIGDSMDDFPWEPSQWLDSDGDGYGDNSGGWQYDSCISIPGNSTTDRFGCPDTDGDGWSNLNDDLPLEPTQWIDGDMDGFGENSEGVNPDSCPMEWGTSTRDRLGCRDLDSDGQSDLNDDFMNDFTQWSDSDGDGLGDNWALAAWNESRMDHWPGEWFENATHPDPTPLDYDGDGYEDWNAGGPFGPYDDCVLTAGTSFRDSIGCTDSDGDGWSDEGDAIDDDATQWHDQDGDGYGDNPLGYHADDCPTQPGTSIIDLWGCPDNDSDGLSNENDECPVTPSNSVTGCPDTDGDGWFDERQEGDIDDCPSEWGLSSIDLKGCPDADGDQVSDINDPFPFDPTQWVDDDDDGFGDNPGGLAADDCLNWAGPSDQGGMYGCPDGDGDGWADGIDLWETDSNLWSDSDADGYADQQGNSDLSDDCPQIYGKSSVGLKGCPDADRDGWPDIL
ncbi:MAG: SBBP repeat-containing protein, partial [Candidatus Thalassarchaeaceae archaeon]|nr:SBBP repeat-containing protein [Candidatus Thalassarchaeaceae archaeon]